MSVRLTRFLRLLVCVFTLAGLGAAWLGEGAWRSVSSAGANGPEWGEGALTDPGARSRLARPDPGCPLILAIKAGSGPVGEAAGMQPRGERAGAAADSAGRRWSAPAGARAARSLDPMARGVVRLLI